MKEEEIRDVIRKWRTTAEILLSTKDSELIIASKTLGLTATDLELELAPKLKKGANMKIRDLFFGTTRLVWKAEIGFSMIPVVNCCKIGPITNERYCPECGKRIVKRGSK